MMVKVTVRVSHALKTKVRRKAKLLGKTQAQLMRDLIYRELEK